MLAYVERPRKKHETEQSATVRAAVVGLIQCLQEFAVERPFTAECEPEHFPREIAGALIELLMAEVLDWPNRISAKLDRPRGGSPNQRDIDKCIRIAVALAAGEKRINDPKADERIVEAFGLASVAVIDRWIINPRYADSPFNGVPPNILDKLLEGELAHAGRVFQQFSPALKSNKTRAKNKKRA